MENKNNKKLTKKDRQDAIIKIILENPEITQDGIIDKLKVTTGQEYTQGTISKDITDLKLKRSDDKKGYIIPIQDKRTLDIEKLKKIAEDFKITKGNVISDIKMMLIKIDGLGNNYNLAKFLKEMYPDMIHDTISTNNSLIIFYSDIVVQELTTNDKIFLTKDIENILSK